MPINIECPKCGRRMRAPDTAAGKKIKCPKCQTLIAVAAAVQQDTYVLKSEEGEEFGPISKDELDEWYEEGRITEDCQILCTGSDQWQWATDLYPDLEEKEADEQPATESESTAEPPAVTESEPPAIDVTEPPPVETAEPPALESTLPETPPAKPERQEASETTRPAGSEPLGRVTIWIIALLVANLFFALMNFIFLLINQFR